MEPPPPDFGEDIPTGPLMSTSEFDEDLALAAEGKWDEVFADHPSQFRPATVEEFLTDA